MKKLLLWVLFLVMSVSLGYLLLDKYAPEQAAKVAEFTNNQIIKIEEKLETSSGSLSSLEATENNLTELESSKLNPIEYSSGEISEPVEILDETWFLYTNDNLGFSIQIPQTSTIRKCKSETSPVEVSVMAYADNTSAYILNSQSYNWETCAEKYNNFSDIKTTHHWKITPKTINNETELNQMIKEIYGQGCSLKSLEASQQDGVYDVKLNLSSLDAPEKESCRVNWASAFKYYPDGKKAVQWNIGQDTNFWNGNDGYDKEMVDSFRFLTSNNNLSDEIQAHINTNPNSNIPLIVTAPNKESLTIFKNFAGNSEYISKVVIQTADGKNAVVTANLQGYPTAIESGKYRATYTNYNLEKNTVDIDVYLSGVHKSHKDIQLNLDQKTAQLKNTFIPKTHAISENKLIDTDAKPEAKEDFYIGTAGQIWSVISCGGGIGLTAISGGAASPMLYLSCGVLVTRVVTSNMDIGPCSGDVLECAKNAVLEVFEHGEKTYTHDDLPEEPPQAEVILDLNPNPNKIITDGTYQALINFTRDNTGMTEIGKGELITIFKEASGSCNLSLNSKNSGTPEIPSGIDLPAGVSMPTITIETTSKSTTCIGTVNEENGEFKLSGNMHTEANSQGQIHTADSDFSITGQIVGTNIKGIINFGEGYPDVNF